MDDLPQLEDDLAAEFASFDHEDHLEALREIARESGRPATFAVQPLSCKDSSSVPWTPACVLQPAQLYRQCGPRLITTCAAP